MTIFGAPWPELSLAHVEAYLDEADDEPLLWEAKGTKLEKNEVGRQVCGFANSHEGGYLILGAERVSSGQSEQKWKLDGVQLPDEPRTWISDVVGDPERGISSQARLRCQGVASAQWTRRGCACTANSTPPCIANGTIYERLPGKTQPVRDPQLLADLFSRGDEARTGAQARADRAALTVMEALEGDAGKFDTGWASTQTEIEAPEDDTKFVRFSVGVAATGNPPNIAGRLFRTEFADEIWQQLRARPTGVPADFARPPNVEWSQEALTWRHQTSGVVVSITIARAAWDGSCAVGQKIATEDAPPPDSLAQQQLAPEWRLADQLVERLGGFSDSYVTVRVAGGLLHRQIGSRHIVVRRGPLLSGFDETHVASVSRELMRAIGRADPEP